MTDASAIRAGNTMASASTPALRPSSGAAATSTNDVFAPAAAGAPVPSEAEIRKAAGQGTSALDKIPTSMLPMGQRAFKYSLCMSTLGQKVPIPGAGGTGSVERTDSHISIKLDMGEFVITSTPGTPDGVSLEHDGKSYQATVQMNGNKMDVHVDPSRSVSMQMNARGFEIGSKGFNKDSIIAKITYQ